MKIHLILDELEKALETKEAVVVLPTEQLDVLVEWASESGEDMNSREWGNGISSCPSCGNFPEERHTLSCVRANLIRRYR